MNKWIIIGLLVVIIGVAAYYFKPWEKWKKTDTDKESDSDPNMPGGSTSDTTNTSSSGSSGTSGSVDATVAITKANAATIQQLQKEINATLSAWAKAGVKNVPAKLVEDGQLGAKTKYAIQFIWAVGTSFKDQRTVTAADMSNLIFAQITLEHVRKSMLYASSQLVDAAKILQASSDHSAYQYLKWLMPV